MMRFAYRHVFMLIGDRDYRHYMSVSLTGRPMTGPDRTKVRVSDRWEWGGRGLRELQQVLHEITMPSI